MQVLKDEIKNKILDIAESTFYEKGFKESTTRSIAKEVGISVSNLYLYYKNKETIFYAVTEGFYNFFISGFEKFLDHHDSNTIIEFNIVELLHKTIIADRKKFVILMDKSEGTKYEELKQEIILKLYNHMTLQVKPEAIKTDYIIYILAKNFIEGVIEIAKNAKDECCLENNLHILVKYHVEGMNHLI